VTSPFVSGTSENGLSSTGAASNTTSATARPCCLPNQNPAAFATAGSFATSSGSIDRFQLASTSSSGTFAGTFPVSDRNPIVGANAPHAPAKNRCSGSGGDVSCAR
jgi:hypothetical protein